MIACTGYNSTIMQALAMRRPEEVIEKITADPAPIKMDCEFSWSHKAERFVLAAGVLHQKPLLDQSHSDIVSSVSINLINAARLIETILHRVPNAHVAVIGSQSGNSGSYDMTYALCKSALHQFVRWRKVSADQVLVCIAPPIIADSGMTRRRKDYPSVLQERRTVQAMDVAALVEKALWFTPAGTVAIWDL